MRSQVLWIRLMHTIWESHGNCRVQLISSWFGAWFLANLCNNNNSRLQPYCLMRPHSFFARLNQIQIFCRLFPCDFSDLKMKTRCRDCSAKNPFQTLRIRTILSPLDHQSIHLSFQSGQLNDLLPCLSAPKKCEDFLWEFVQFFCLMPHFLSQFTWWKGRTSWIELVRVHKNP